MSIDNANNNMVFEVIVKKHYKSHDLFVWRGTIHVFVYREPNHRIIDKGLKILNSIKPFIFFLLKVLTD